MLKSMLNFSNNMAIVMMAFLISCGQVEEEKGNSQNIGGIINLLESSDIDTEEQDLIKSTCSSLRDKKRQMKSVASNPLNSFQFKAKKEDCSQRGRDFNYNVAVRSSDSGIIFKSTSNRVFEGFAEIIFDDYRDLKDFCINAYANTLSAREVVTGDSLVSISTKRDSDKTTISLYFAKKKRTNEFEIISSEQFVVKDNYQGLFGLVTERVTSDRLGCSSGEKKKYAELVSVRL